MERRYTTTEREALAVIRSLAEVKWLVQGSNHPTKVYTDHQALETILNEGTDAHGRIARWLDRLTEYDYEVHHRPCKSNIIRIADGLSRMPGRYSQYATAVDLERIALVVTAPTQTGLEAESVRLRKEVAALAGVQSHRIYRDSKWYGKITSYILDGESSLADYSRTEKKAIKRESYRYRVTDQHLLFVERGGETARCILPSSVQNTLRWAHEDHGHFSSPLTLNKLRGQAYWPHRVSDVERFCRTCDACQYDGPKKKSTNIRPILRFHPYSMVGMDFLGPIKPVCTVTGYKYVLVIVDYFSRFVWAKGCIAADQENVSLYWINEHSPVFGFPRCLYTDNGTHFTGSEVTTLFEGHGTSVITAPITHPSSVGLVERNVQLVSSQLRKWVFQRGPQAKYAWGRSLPEIMPNINGRLVRTHGFTPAEIFFGYNPQYVVTQREPTVDLTNGEGQDEQPGTLLHQWMDLRDENNTLAVRHVAEGHTQQEGKTQALWTKPQAGDLVLVRDFTRDKDFGRKLDMKWLGPRLLVEISESGVAGYVQNLHGDGEVKRYHLDDIKTYHPRAEGQNTHTSIERTAMACAGFPGQRAVDLGLLFV